MNMQSNKPRLSAMLGQVASIASVRATSLGITRLDKEASKEADRMHNAKPGTGKVRASRIAGAEHRVGEMADIATECRNKLNEMTTAWGTGQRLLTNQLLKEWLEFFAPRQAQFKTLRERFIQDAPAIIADAEMNKGTYNVAPPTMHEIQQAFSLEFDIQQIPDSETFKSNSLSAELEAEMRRHFEASIEAAYTRAMNDAFKRVAKPLSNLVERLTEYSRVEEEQARGLDIKSTRLYETVITNIVDIADVFGNFNLTGDVLMDRVNKSLDDFRNIDIDDLKRDKGLRDNLTKKAQAILSDIADLI